MGPKYLIVGAGKTATHLSYYFDLLKIPHQKWSRQSSTHLSQILKPDSKVLLCISDSAIQRFAQQYLAGQQVYHFSGAHEFPGLTGMHPLVSFGPSLYDLDFYQKIPFVLTQGRLQDYLPELSNPSWTIPAQKKAYYHALCVLSGNFTTLLWQKMFQGMQELQMPPSAAEPYLESILQNLLKNKLSALTGPLARKDHSTVQQNLAALENDSFKDVYLSFQKIFFPEYNPRNPL